MQCSLKLLTYTYCKKQSRLPPCFRPPTSCVSSSSLTTVLQLCSNLVVGRVFNFKTQQNLFWLHGALLQTSLSERRVRNPQLSIKWADWGRCEERKGVERRWWEGRRKIGHLSGSNYHCICHERSGRTNWPHMSWNELNWWVGLAPIKFRWDDIRWVMWNELNTALVA